MTQTSLLFLGGRLFRPHSSTDNSQTQRDTIFKYEQRDNLITAHYSGGNIKFGQLIGLINQAQEIEFRYHHVSFQSEIFTGRGRSTVEVLANNKMRLHEQWQWTSGDQSEGRSILEEI